MKKISLRTSDGWSKRVKNEGKFNCDIDGARLWIGPGDQIYCDLVHSAEDVEKQSRKQ
jgi:hypothetical protein